MTNKYVYDAASRTRMRVVGATHTWQQLGPGVRVRRRVVGPEGSHEAEDDDPTLLSAEESFDDLFVDLK